MQTYNKAIAGLAAGAIVAIASHYGITLIDSEIAPVVAGLLGSITTGAIVYASPRNK